jgi:hypothetical protein
MWQLYYKHIVLQIENFIKKTTPEHYISGIYLIDAILRKTRTEVDVGQFYKKRFAINIENTLRTCFRCPLEDKVCVSLFLWNSQLQKKMRRVVKLWVESNSLGRDNNEKLKRALKHQAKKERECGLIRLN